MSIFDLFRKKTNTKSYEEIWHDAKDPGTSPTTETGATTTNGPPKKPANRTAGSKKETRPSSQMRGAAQLRAEANQKAKEIHGDKAYGIRTVYSLEKPVEDRFEDFQRTVDDVAKGTLPCCFIYGTPGTGKSWTVEQVMVKRGLVLGEDYAWLTSKCTPASLYEQAISFRHGGIIVLDDVDFTTGSAKKQMMELIKAMTDSQLDRRIVSWTTQGANIQKVLSPEEGEKVIKQREKGETKKAPSQFKFDGRLIIITNLTESDFDPALLSRAIPIPLFLTEEEKLVHMRNKLREIEPEMDLGTKERVLTALIEFHEMNTLVNKEAKTDKLDKTQLDLRTLVQALALAKVDEQWEKRLYLL